jgi:hypothetical protein
VLAREASDRVGPTASYVGHIVNNGRDSVDGGVRSLHPPRHHGGPCLQRQRDPGRGVDTVSRAREASDRVDPTASSVGHIVNNGRDNVVGGGRHLHPHDTTGDPTYSVNVTLAEV